MRLALSNAAEMIRGHVENGGFPEDFLGKGATIEDLELYQKCCERVSKRITNMIKEYEEK